MKEGRTVVKAQVLALLILLSVGPAEAIHRDAFREARDRYEGLTFRLRLELRAAGHAVEPNVVSLEGVGGGRERSPVLFGRLEKVYVERVMSEGATRLGLTVYRSQEEAERLRATAIPQPGNPNPNFGRTMAAFAQQGSTTVVLDLKSGKKDPQGQLEEIETLLGRVFYLKGEPTREELEDFVRQNRGMPMSRLRSLTGLPAEAIRALLSEGAGGDPQDSVGP
jgi:hypothetical protein